MSLLLGLLACLLLVGCGADSSGRGGGGNASASLKHYLHVQPCNTTESLLLVESLPLRYYSMPHDPLPGRRHLGLTGTDAEAVIPDMVHRVARKLVGVDPVRRQPVYLHDYAVIDHDHVFMHGVGAAQELLARQRALERRLAAAVEQNGAHAAALTTLQRQVAQERAVDALERRRAAEAGAERVLLEVAHERVRAEEARATAEVRRNGSAALLQRKHALEAERLAADDAAQRSRNAALVALQEASAEAAELRRRETERQLRERKIAAEGEQAALDRAAQLKKVQAEAEGRLRAERENEDVRMRQLQAQAAEDRKRLIEAIETGLRAVGAGARDLLSDQQKLLTTIGALVTLAAGVYTVREAAKLVAQQVEKRLGRPSLVRETSRRTGMAALALWLRTKLWPCGAGRRGGGGAGSVALLRRQFGDVILQTELKARVESLAVSVANARRHGAPFRHLMLYGPPGTGKTMVAKRLARGSGLDYAIMSGGDVGPLGADAVTQLHALFAWAAASPHGLLLFIDEAEAFLASRARRAMSEAQRNALNALLFQTGEQSNSFMMVLATNRPGDLDTAVTDRVDEAFSFPLPGHAERCAMLRLYYDMYIAATSRLGGGLWAKLRHSRLLFGPFARVHAGIKVEDVGGGGGSGMPDDLFVALARDLEGFSGREIAKLMISVQGAAYGSATGRLTREMLLRVVQWKVQEHRAKTRMAKAGAAGLV